MLFIARWLSDALHLALALGCGLLLMQVPALTHEYAAALDLLAQDSRRDIDAREQAARQFYTLPAANTEAEVLAALRGREPSNAATLAQSIERARVLQAAAARIAAAQALLRPVVAAVDAAQDGAVKLPVLRSAAGSHQAQIALTEPAAVYGLVGLLLGSLLARVVSAVLARLGRRRQRSAQYDFG